ncbi:hypothetical protein EI94DRAFT_1587168 [Lactarius quietus]|nr:hypothetical protein EI94DRAFT_1587168 [Lactarius quietus]
MAHQLAHFDIYREELAKAYPGFGYALWEPGPGEQNSHVEVGDVGFVREGQFNRLFNALLPGEHESHGRFGVPEGHEPLRLTVADHINRRDLTPNTFHSHGVSVQSGGLQVLAATTVGSAEVSFSCTRKHGAALSLPVSARCENTLTLGHFRKWMIKHIDSWLTFTHMHGLGLEMEDIVLVTGCHRTRSWSNIAFNEFRKDAQFSLGVEVAGSFGASINWRASSLRVQGAVLSQGPSGEVCGMQVARTDRY